MAITLDDLKHLPSIDRTIEQWLDLPIFEVAEITEGNLISLVYVAGAVIDTDIEHSYLVYAEHRTDATKISVNFYPLTDIRGYKPLKRL